MKQLERARRPARRALQDILSRCHAGRPARSRRDCSVSEYVTDGTNLYRFLGWGLAGDFAEFEDCRSLELFVVPRCELRKQWLRPVAVSAP